MKCSLLNTCSQGVCDLMSDSSSPAVEIRIAQINAVPFSCKFVIQENGRKYIERILSAVTESGFDMRAVPSVFMGGGSAILKRHVTAQDAICRPVFIEDVHANAAGYERIVEQMWAK